MSCFKPISAEQSPAGTIRLWSKGNGRALQLPCGKCIGCKMDRRRMWSIRIMHEASLHDANWFLTLTYDDEKLAKLEVPRRLDPSLDYRDYQLFMKKLRKKYGTGIRFFCAGEYGGKNYRPHFHAILFNALLDDVVPFLNGTFRSKRVEDLWGVGDVVIGSVSAQSAAYVAGYTLKKVHGAVAAAHYEDVVNVRTGELGSRRPEFVAMSLKPGIGTRWYEKFYRDLFPADRAVQEGTCYKVPRFYWNKFKEEAEPCMVEEIEYQRYLKACENLPDGTPERLAVREVVAQARADMYSEHKL